MTRRSFRFASRPVRAAVAVKIAFVILAADVSLACAKVILTKNQDHAAVATIAVADAAVLPAIVAVDQEPCRLVSVATDEGYGVRGKTTRLVCRKAL